MPYLIVLVIAVVVVVLVMRAAAAPARPGLPRSGRRAVPPRPAPGPDDDPEFLRELERRARRDDNPTA